MEKFYWYKVVLINYLDDAIFNFDKCKSKKVGK